MWADLGLDASLLVQPMVTLSGGQAARVELAAILLSRFDVLLLDEPTNDLDLDGLERLETFVTGLDAGVVLVSHDRAFLERVVTSVVELDEHDRRAARFDGGWLAYQDERGVARRHAEEAYRSYDDRRRDLEERARRQRAWTRAGVSRAAKHPRDNDKFVRRWAIASAEGRSGDAKRTDRALERLERGRQAMGRLGPAARAGRGAAQRQRGGPARRGRRRARARSGSGPWTSRSTGPTASPSSAPTAAGRRRCSPHSWATVGLTAGTRWFGPSVVVGQLDQARLRLDRGRPLLDGFLAETGMTVSDARTLLAKFGLGADDIGRPVGGLSPGERTRAALALFSANGRQLPRARRADEPPRPARHRAARTSARHASRARCCS